MAGHRRFGAGSGRGGGAGGQCSGSCSLLRPPAPCRDAAPALALALAATAAVLATSAAALAARARPPLPGWAAERATAAVQGRASDDPRPLPPDRFGAGPRWVVSLASSVVTARGRRVAAPGPVTVFGGAGWQRVQAGEHVTAIGRLLPRRRGDPAAASLAAVGPPRSPRPGALPWRVAARLRAGLRTAAGGLGTDAAGLLPALVVGDTSRLPVSLRDAMRASGLSHLTAVSGANLTVLTGTVATLASALGTGRRVRLWLIAATVAGFVVLARPEPSVLRAAAMGVVGVLGLAFGRRVQGVPALGAAVLALLVIDPWLARSYGFALSAVATSGLLLLAPWLGERLAARMPRPLAAALAVPAAALVCTAPVAVLLRPALSLVALPANLLAAPAVAPATVLGVIAAAVSPLSPALARAVAVPAGAAAWWIAAVARRAAVLPGARVPWVAGPGGAALLAAAILVVPLARRAWCSVARQRGGPRHRAPVSARARRPPLTAPPRPPRTPQPRPPGSSRPLTGRLTVLAGLAVPAALVGWLVAPAAPGVLGSAWGIAVGSGYASGWPPPGWRAVQCDVGQGDALVIRSGPDRAMLIDAGPDARLVDACLRRLNVRHLDLVVITHDHADHASGLPGALRGRGAAEVLLSPLDQPASVAREVHTWAAAAGARVVTGRAGMRGAVGSAGWQVRWAVLWPLPASPGAVLEDSGDSIEGSMVNDASVVLAIEAGGLRLLDLGDLETAAQGRLEQEVTLHPPIDVVKVSHHGSARQDPSLYARMRPRVALIGVGPNTYGHPTSSTLAMLRSVGALIMRTDRQGDVALVSGPKGLAVATSGPGR